MLYQLYIMISDSEIVMQSRRFVVKNQNGEDVLRVSPDLVATNFRTIKLQGKAQALKSLQAQQIFSMPSTDMKIASLTKNLKIQAVNQLNLGTTIGALGIRALKNVEIEAEKVQIRSQ